MKAWLAILLFSTTSVYAQINVNSFEEALQLHELGKDTSDSNPAVSLELLLAANDWFSQAPNSGDKIDNYWWIAIAFSNIGQYDTAKTYYKSAALQALNLNDYGLALDIQNSYVLRCLIVTGGNFDSELMLALKIKEKAKILGDNEILLKANRLLIDLYWDLPAFKEEMVELAIENDALSIALNDSSQMTFSLFDLAYAYSVLDKSELAINTYKRVIKTQLSRGDLYVSASYNNLANQYVKINEIDSAIHYYELGMHYSYLQNRMDGVAASNLYLGELYLKTKNWKKALKLCSQGLEIFRDNNILRRQDACAACINQAYVGLGDKASAYDYMLLQNSLEDSLLSVDEIQDLRKMENDFNHQLQSITDSLAFNYQQDLKQTEIDQHKTQSYILWAIIAITIVFTFFIFNRFRITRKQKRIIEVQKSRVEQAHVELSSKNQEILDSIVYAKRIQSAILPQLEVFTKVLPNSFVLYLPKDIVAGDFYWLEESQNRVLFAAADCTGHGVPGAMVSVICNNGLNRSVREHGILDPGKILDKTREIVIKEFEKSKDEVRDGMDIALCSLYKEGSKTYLEYAGANNPLWIVKNNSGDLIEIKGDKQPIGKYADATPYQTTTLNLEQGDTLYIFTDGFQDQFGGDKGKKFKAKNFKELLLSLQNQPFDQHQHKIKEAFENWRGELEQLDDICIIGIRI